MKNSIVRNSLSLAAMILGCSVVASAAAADNGSTNKNGVTIYPMPKGEKPFDGYQLQIDGQPVPVYSCRVSAVPFNQWFPGYQRPLDQTELAGFAYWDMNGSVKIEVTSQQAVTGVSVRPLSLGIKPKVDGNKISFDLNTIVPITVEVNGYHNALHLFPGPEQKDARREKPPVCTYQCSYCSPVTAYNENKYPALSTDHVIHFGPGVHDVGTLQLKSGDTVSIDGGAVVYGCFIAFHATNIRIYGRGILDGSRIERNDQRGIGGFGCMYFRNCSKITVEGIVLRDPAFWGVTIRDSSEVNMSNLKLVGFWRYNADGIDLWNCRDMLVENCFVRSFDDALVVRGGINDMKNIRFNRCVLWCDWGIAMEIFTVNSPNAPTTIENITFENINVIRTTAKVMNITHVGQVISNVVYSNVNVEIDERPLRPQLQKTKDAVYVIDPKDQYSPALITVSIPKHRPATGGTLSTIDGLHLNDVSIYGSSNAASSIKVSDAYNGAVSNVMIKNLRMNGTVADDLKKVNMSISSNVNGVQIVP